MAPNGRTADWVLLANCLFPIQPVRRACNQRCSFNSALAAWGGLLKLLSTKTDAGADELLPTITHDEDS